jgi:hypothetical protein
VRRAALVVVAAALALPGAAGARDGVRIGGTVDSVLGLTVLDDPAGLGAFPKAGTTSVALHAEVTSTTEETTLSVADGDANAAPKHGHLVSAAGVLPLPLEVAAGDAAFLPLDPPVDPLLRRWTAPLAAQAVTVTVRQRTTAPAPGDLYHKTLLITVAATTP